MPTGLLCELLKELSAILEELSATPCEELSKLLELLTSSAKTTSGARPNTSTKLKKCQNSFAVHPLFFVSLYIFLPYVQGKSPFPLCPNITFYCHPKYIQLFKSIEQTGTNEQGSIFKKRVNGHAGAIQKHHHRVKLSLAFGHACHHHVDTAGDSRGHGHHVTIFQHGAFCKLCFAGRKSVFCRCEKNLSLHSHIGKRQPTFSSRCEQKRKLPLPITMEISGGNFLAEKHGVKNKRQVLN